MRSSVYLFATAILAATSIPALATEMMTGESSVVVYGDAYVGTAHDAAYGNPYGETYASSEEAIYLEEAAPADVEYVEAPAEILTYSPEITYAPEAVESLYAVEEIEQAPMVTTETIDGIVYETVNAPAQTY